MSKLTIEVRHGELMHRYLDWECIEFHGDIVVDSIWVGQHADTTVNLTEPNADSIFVGRDGWTIWVCDEEAKLRPEWEQLYPEKEAEVD